MMARKDWDLIIFSPTAIRDFIKHLIACEQGHRQEWNPEPVNAYLLHGSVQDE